MVTLKVMGSYAHQTDADLKDRTSWVPRTKDGSKKYGVRNGQQKRFAKKQRVQELCTEEGQPSQLAGRHEAPTLGSVTQGPNDMGTGPISCNQTLKNVVRVAENKPTRAA